MWNLAHNTKAEILVISRVFFPDTGGIQEYAYNRCLQDPDQIIVLTSACAGDQSFDCEQPFPIYRWPMSAMTHLGALGSFLKQILNILWSVVLAIRLHQRYRYRYIEWCHGYDFLSLLLLSYLLPVQCVIYLHGDDVLCPLKNPVFRWLFEWTLRRTTTIVCNSNFTRNYLIDNFQVDTPIRVIHPTVRPEKFGQHSLEQVNHLRAQIRQQHQIPEQAIAILSVGRLVKRKGFDRVIENLPNLIAEGIDVYYIICGQGAMASELRLLAEKLGVTSRIIFAGYVPDEELTGYYAACDIFSLLTFFDSKQKSIEGFGIVYLEAGYFAKPVIASRVGGVEDAVLHENNGLLVNPNSTVETFAMLRQLCRDRKLRERLGSQGKELATRITPHRTLYIT
ncbi:glycosyltransferase family 4 protein [Calothrix sp. PCC 7507]|uniref:glycosyltransferase family 4 protein n=1 Tax=Calothrix sp. PCC 7507 TaxID=99598 RepID=UPI00029EC52F|nr:glycosyltransferase family 4 protein [Calothrix sp. PCC 7507]AFY32498.1 glycosyl transferase group 1 [Calothrix sp. PCC 7507]